MSSHSKNSPGYGTGTYELGASEKADAEAATRLVTTVKAKFSDPGYTPPLLPGAALEINQLASNPNVDVGKVVSVLEQDQLLAARVLKIARSAAYNSRGTVPSLRDAVMRLGLRTLGEIVWEVATTMRVFRSRNYAPAMDRLRKHSAACAYLSRLVATKTALATEYAFLCGLLHDVGIAASLVVIGEEDDRKAARSPVPEAMLAPALSETHADASATVARLWQLPPDVQLVLGSHHTIAIGNAVHPLAATIVVAEAIAERLGFGMGVGRTPCDTTETEVVGRACESLRISAEQLKQLATDARKVLGALPGADPS